MPLVMHMIFPATTSYQIFFLACWKCRQRLTYWPVHYSFSTCSSSNYYFKSRTKLKFDILNQTKKEMTFSAFSSNNILEAKRDLCCIKKQASDNNYCVYSPQSHPVKLNNLLKCKARLRPETGRPSPGLSPPTHCQLHCFSKARK